MSIRVVESLNVREIVTASRGLSMYGRVVGAILSGEKNLGCKASDSLRRPT